MLRIFFVFVVIFINFIFENTLLANTAFFGISPNTAIIVIVSFAVMRQEYEGAIIGFIIGLLVDILFGNVVGLNALFYMLIGFLAGKPFKEFYLENYVLPFLLVGIFTILYNFFYYIINFLFRARLDLASYFLRIILPETIINIIITVPIYCILFLVNYKIEKIENEKRKMF